MDTLTVGPLYAGDDALVLESDDEFQLCYGELAQFYDHKKIRNPKRKYWITVSETPVRNANKCELIKYSSLGFRYGWRTNDGQNMGVFWRGVENRLYRLGLPRGKWIPIWWWLEMEKK